MFKLSTLVCLIVNINTLDSIGLIFSLVHQLTKPEIFVEAERHLCYIMANFQNKSKIDHFFQLILKPHIHYRLKLQTHLRVNCTKHELFKRVWKYHEKCIFYCVKTPTKLLVNFDRDMSQIKCNFQCHEKWPNICPFSGHFEHNSDQLSKRRVMTLGLTKRSQQFELEWRLLLNMLDGACDYS